ncbi:hypothetical protein BDR04DRAFT_1152577 [Suillus decipiens]|nr:hypothetical protein BDR04DRAFT_1152577 [Suillus decipiens]
MELATQFRSHDLPMKLILLIHSIAAIPTFTQPKECTAQNLYPMAFAPCRIPKDVRRTVFQEFLHTTSPSQSEKARAFVRALNTEKYHKMENSIRLDYARYVCKIWIRESGGNINITP